jgi:hypothetical protein
MGNKRIQMSLRGLWAVMALAPLALAMGCNFGTTLPTPFVIGEGPATVGHKRTRFDVGVGGGWGRCCGWASGGGGGNVKVRHGVAEKHELGVSALAMGMSSDGEEGRYPAHFWLSAKLDYKWQFSRYAALLAGAGGGSLVGVGHRGGWRWHLPHRWHRGWGTRRRFLPLHGVELPARQSVVAAHLSAGPVHPPQVPVRPLPARCAHPRPRCARIRSRCARPTPSCMPRKPPEPHQKCTESLPKPAESLPELPQRRQEPAQSRARPAQSRARPAQSRARPAQSRARPAQSRARPAQSRARPARPRPSLAKWHVRSPESPHKVAESREKTAQAPPRLEGPQPSTPDLRPTKPSQTGRPWTGTSSGAPPRRSSRLRSSSTSLAHTLRGVLFFRRSATT